MTRAQFITEFEAKRRANYDRAIKAGTMRPSEAAMGMADAKADAIKSWRKHRHYLGEAEPGAFFKLKPIS